MSSAKGDGEGHFHAVRFYDDSEALCRIVGDFLAGGLAAADPAIVIATPAHAASIAKCLKAKALDVGALKRSGDLVVLDARETLAVFMMDGLPDANAFGHHMTEVLRQVCRGRRDCTLRAYGEMVDLLWKDGLSAAAIRLETLWNQLANVHDFKLLCGYSMGNFYKGAAMDEIRGQHSHLVSDIGHSFPIH
jgi:hypothetical protein